MNKHTAAVLCAIEGAVATARIKHPGAYASPHQAYALALEELDEYWDEVRAKKRNHSLMLHELIDLAAVCVRAATEVHLAKMPEYEILDALAVRQLGLPVYDLLLRIRRDDTPFDPGERTL